MMVQVTWANLQCKAAKPQKVQTTVRGGNVQSFHRVDLLDDGSCTKQVLKDGVNNV